MVERPEPRQQKLTPACNAHWRCHADVRAAQEQFCIGAPEALRAQASTRADVKEALRHRKNKSDETSVLLQSINLTGFSQSRFSSIGGRSTGGDASSGRPAVWGSPSCVPGVHPHPRHLMCPTRMARSRRAQPPDSTPPTRQRHVAVAAPLVLRASRGSTPCSRSAPANSSAAASAPAMPMKRAAAPLAAPSLAMHRATLAALPPVLLGPAVVPDSAACSAL